MQFCLKVSPKTSKPVEMPFKFNDEIKYFIHIRSRRVKRNLERMVAPLLTNIF